MSKVRQEKTSLRDKYKDSILARIQSLKTCFQLNSNEFIWLERVEKVLKKNNVTSAICRSYDKQITHFEKRVLASKIKQVLQQPQQICR